VSTKTQRFSELLAAPETVFAMEAHSGLSAKVVEEAGFPVVWASGLSISAALGLRDRNEASWTQVLEVLEYMSDATSIPILLDGDTGYGDFNNFRRLVRKLCARDVAAVCIEDKIFPKTNSFLDGDQMLTPVEEFCGKLRVGKDSQTDPDFRIIARTEALIAGRGMNEALDRAHADREAGADAILIHSRKSTADEVLRFAAAWEDSAPLVVVPTKYYATPTRAFRDAGISLVIWANHTLRASLAAMRETTREIARRESLVEVEGRVAGLDEVFALVGNDELAAAETRYLPQPKHGTRAIVLAATCGGQFEALTRDKPKCMLDVRGEPLLSRLRQSLGRAGVGAVTVVGGYRADAIDVPGIRKVANDAYETSGEAASLACALDDLDGHCIVSYGDILFRDYVLDLLQDAEGDVVIFTDTRERLNGRPPTPRTADWVVCARNGAPHSLGDPLDDTPIRVTGIARATPPDDACGEFIGLVKLSPAGAEAVRAELAAMQTDGTLENANLPDLFARLVAREVPVHAVQIAGHWLDVNDAFDLADARNFL